MKTKNLLKTLVVFALVVPFALGLAACGKNKKEFETVSAETAYNQVVKAFVTTSDGDEPEPYDPLNDLFGLDEFTVKYTAEVSAVDEEDQNVEIVAGYSKQNGLFRVEKEDGATTYEEFVVKEDEAFVEYLLNEQRTGYTKNAVASLDDVKDNALSFEIAGFDDYEKMPTYFISDYENFAVLTEADKCTVEGRKYKDGSYSLVISYKTEENLQDGTPEIRSSYEFVVKDGKLLKVVVSGTAYEQGEETSSIDAEIQIEYSYNTSFIPSNFNVVAA